MSSLAHCGEDSQHGPHDHDGGHCVGTPAGYERQRGMGELRSSFRRGDRIQPPPVVWGLTLCYRTGCAETAVLAIDGWPFCLDHGDDEVERTVALELNPALVRSGGLPDLEERH